MSENVIGGTTSGSGNVIAHNVALGVELSDQPLNSSSSAPTNEYGNSILGNSIHDNGNGNVFVDRTEIWLVPDSDNPLQGPNGLQPAPLLSMAAAGPSTTVTGSLSSTANSTFGVVFFASPGVDAWGTPRARSYLGFAAVNTDGSGNA